MRESKAKQTDKNRAAALSAANTLRLSGKFEARTEKIKQAMLAVDSMGVSKYQHAARKGAAKVRESNEAAGNWVPLESKCAFDQYRSKVAAASRAFTADILQLPNAQLRGPSGKVGAYHLDHKMSVWYGFKHGVPAEMIGHIANLEMKPWQDNQRKWSKSDHTLEQLKEKIASW
jgi:hypothetical protein